MTFEKIAARAKLRTLSAYNNLKQKGMASLVNYVMLAREAENEFIKKALCTEAHYTTDTSVGSLSSLYDVPDGFIKEIVVYWKNYPLMPAAQGEKVKIYKSDGTLYTGSPIKYWIENNQIRLLPKPNSHSYIYWWYVKYNTSETGDSPIIKEPEHIYLVDYVIAEVLGMDERESSFFIERFYRNAAEAKERYFDQRQKVGHILNESEGETYYPTGEQARVPIIT